jgi:predicted transcriptional regulator
MNLAWGKHEGRKDRTMQKRKSGNLGKGSPQVGVRLEPEMYSWLEQYAKKNTKKDKAKAIREILQKFREGQDQDKKIRDIAEDVLESDKEKEKVTENMVRILSESSMQAEARRLEERLQQKKNAPSVAGLNFWQQLPRGDAIQNKGNDETESGEDAPPPWLGEGLLSRIKEDAKKLFDESENMKP